MDMKTTNIKGKEYVMVNERIKAFRSTFKDYRLSTEILEISDKHCLMVAKVINSDGVVVANGYAREVVEKSPINKFAYVENCETSAVGRALGFFGIGVDTAICSAEELNTKLSYEDNAPVQDEKAEPQLTKEQIQAKVLYETLKKNLLQCKGKNMDERQYNSAHEQVANLLKVLDKEMGDKLKKTFSECCQKPVPQNTEMPVATPSNNNELPLENIA